MRADPLRDELIVYIERDPERYDRALDRLYERARRQYEAWVLVDHWLIMGAPWRAYRQAEVARYWGISEPAVHKLRMKARTYITSYMKASRRTGG